MSKNVSFIDGLSGDGEDHVPVGLRQSNLPSNWLLAVVGLPMLIAVGISGYLTWVSMTGSQIAGCSGQLFDCSHVLYSKWSKAYGVPVSAMAVLTYLGMITATAVTANRRNAAAIRETAWMVVTLLAISAALAALYFIFLQVFVLEHLCPWCLGAHACGLLISAALLVSRSRISLGKLSAVSGLATAGLALLIGIQVSSEEPPKYELVEYVPKTSILASTNSGEQTYTSAPLADEILSEDGFLAPPGVDDGMFAPPVEMMDSFFEPPGEDDGNSSDVSLFESPFYRQLETSVALVGQIATFRNSLSSVLVHQQQGSSSKQKGSSTKKQGSLTKQQTAKTTKPQAKKKKPLRVVQFMGRKINAYQWPIDGSPTAKHIFVEMFDYTCPHCRSTSRAICEVKKQMAGDLSVIVLPVPMNSRCNPAVQADHAMHQEACELSTLAVAVWRCDAEKFSTFHHWMFEGEDAPSYSDAFAKAGELLGSEALNKEMKKGTASAFVTSHCKMYQLVNGGAVPKLLFPTTAIQGEFTSVQELTKMIREKAISP